MSKLEAKRRARDRCELCHLPANLKNYLSAHHIDGDPSHDETDNLLVVHRFVCHTAADLVTQHCALKGVAPTRRMIERFWAAIGEPPLRPSVLP